jgi:hypothetical protein
VKIKWDGEEEHIPISRLETAPSATCHRGNAPEEYTGAEVMVDGGGVAIHKFVQDFLDFQDGGGQIQITPISPRR